MMNRNGRTGIAWLTGLRAAASLWLCCAASCRAGEKSDNGGHGQGTSFARIVIDPTVGWHRPPEGKDFGLTLVPPKDKGIAVPRKLWVQRITKRIPALRNPASWQQLAKELGLDPKLRKVGGHHRFVRTGTSEGMTIQGTGQVLTYGDSTPRDWDELAAAAEKNSMKKVKDMGEARVKKLGLWPKGVNMKSAQWGPHVAMVGSKSFISKVSARYKGLVDGIPAAGPGFELEIDTHVNGKLDVMRMRWFETRRYRELPCKTVREAFEALNRGHAMGIPKFRFGKSVHYEGWTYYVGTMAGDYVHPVFKFRIMDPADPKDHGAVVYVPAVKSKYFENPKRQMVSAREVWTERWRKKQAEARAKAKAEADAKRKPGAKTGKRTDAGTKSKAGARKEPAAPGR